MKPFTADYTLQDAVSATGNGTAIDASGFTFVGLQITGTFVATVTFEATIDQTNWVAIPVSNSNTIKLSTTATAAGLYAMPVKGYAQIRARVTWTSGTSITVVARGVTEGTLPLVGFDAITYAQTTIDYAHHEIHDGSAYFAVYSALKDDTGFIEVRVQTPNTTKWAHMIIVIDCALAGTAQLWKPTTKTHEAGNVMALMNRNHNSTTASGLTVCHTPGGTQSGTSNLTRYLGAATTGGRADQGGRGGSGLEFILDQNNDYLIRVTSRADSNALTILLDWYEHTNR